MIIRAATKKDAGAITAIWNQEIRDGISTFNSVEKSEEDIRVQICDRGEAFLVAEISGQVVGFVTFFQFRGGVGYTHTMEHTIHLSQEARGKGAGRALMASIEDVARGKGVHVLVSGVAGENEAGVAFHRALGFVEVGRMPEVGQKFGRWMDLVLMQKIL